MNNEVRFKDRLGYWLDNLFSKGTAALIGGLAVLSLVIIVISALFITAGGLTQDGESGYGFGEAMWLSLMRTLDAGTMGGDTGWGFRVVMLILPTLGGIFILSTLIGVLSSGIESKLEALRKGRSPVIESGHTVILGWSEQIFTIISELVAANANLSKSCIVIMGQKDKVEMEEEIQAKVESFGKTRVVCRSGSPMEMADLSLLSLNTSKSIIVISPDAEEPDSQVIKTVLAITHHPNRRPQPYNIVAEIRDMKNMDAARVAGKTEVEWVLVGDLIARIVAQTSRQSGLSVVYTELLDFGGDEIYIHAERGLSGKTFAEALRWYEKNAVIGLRTPEQGVRLNPPMETVIREGDEIVIIAEDDDKISLNKTSPGSFKEAAINGQVLKLDTPEHDVILGWNWRGKAILRELDQYVVPGSQVLVVAEQDGIDEDLESCRAEVSHLTIEYLRGDITNRRLLDSLQLDRFNHVVLLCYSDRMDTQAADASTLITLLHLRDISEKSGSQFSIVSEMLDIRNRNLADVTRADDFIVSDKLVSLMLAQVSENKYLNAVFADFFDPEGSEIYLRPACNYIHTGEPVDFYTVVEAARRRKEVAFGYRIAADAKDASRSYGVHINPPKSETVNFCDEDRVIVLSEG